MSQARFQKMQREKARREKAQAKAERKALRAEEAEAAATAPEEPVADQSTVLARLAELHERFDADEIDFDTFDEQKQELIAQLDI